MKDNANTSYTPLSLLNMGRVCGRWHRIDGEEKFSIRYGGIYYDVTFGNRNTSGNVPEQRVSLLLPLQTSFSYDVFDLRDFLYNEALDLIEYKGNKYNRIRNNDE